MSASSKKKLRKEQNAAILTEKQQKEQKEAKKLKIYSVIFVAVMLVVVITAITVMAVKGIQGSGIIEKNTVAATVGDHEINAVDMNYYFTDAATNTYSEWSSMYGDAASSYMAMMGLDTTLPLDEQPYYGDPEMTWADYFMDVALENAKADYALYDKAVAEGFTLSEDDQASLDNAINNAEMYALIYGYTDLDAYLKALYGPAASRKSYEAYTQVSGLANAYYTAYYESLEYDDDAIRAHEKDIYNNYTSYSYASYYLNYSKFLPEEAATDPSEDQIAAAQAVAKAAADSLLSATTIEELDAAIAALDINAEVENAASTKAEDTLYTGISTIYNEWLAEDVRQENEITVVPYESTSTDEEGNETTTLNGYYVVMYLGKNENTEPMGNVRHLLVEFETDADGNVTDEAKAAAKAEADGYLKTWQEGEATQDSFIALVKEHSDDSSAADGGLFEDINPASAYVENFLNWSIDPNRAEGNAEVIETEYGYHVMYYVGDDELTYRDYLITNDMMSADLETWYNGIVDAVTIVEGNLSRVKTGLILTPNT